MARNWKRTVGALAALAIMAIGLSVATDNVEATGLPRYTVSSSPTELAQAAGQSVSITYTNTTLYTVPLVAINVSVPAGLSVASPTLNKPGTVTFNASKSRFELRSMNIGRVAPNNSVTLTFTLTSAIPPECQTYVFASDARWSNSFSTSLNKFYRSGPDATFTAPCNTATVTCTAGDTQACTTGEIFGPTGSQAEVTVDDSDLFTATLTATLVTGALQCPEYTASSDQLEFDADITNGADPTGVTKTVTFSGPTIDARQAYEYQVCFAAPYDFPAQLPSQLLQDFNTGDFSGNTTFDGTEYRGLLLPCSAGYDVPCIVSRTIADGRINISISTSVADPRTRY